MRWSKSSNKLTNGNLLDQTNKKNFWCNKLTALHEDLTRALNDIVNDPRGTPGWLNYGTTFLLSKGKDRKDPKNYCPITCLPTTYKILSAALMNRIYSHLLKNRILPDEQKGCRRVSWGCKDQLFVSKMFVAMPKKLLRNLGMVWIEYKKSIWQSAPYLDFGSHGDLQSLSDWLRTDIESMDKSETPDRRRHPSFKSWCWKTLYQDKKWRTWTNWTWVWLWFIHRWPKQLHQVRQE